MVHVCSVSSIDAKDDEADVEEAPLLAKSTPIAPRLVPSHLSHRVSTVDEQLDVLLGLEASTSTARGGALGACMQHSDTTAVEASPACGASALQGEAGATHMPWWCFGLLLLLIGGRCTRGDCAATHRQLRCS